MTKKIRLSPAEGWVELQTTAADWKNADPKLLGTMLSQLHLIRAFEEQVLELAGEGLVHGPAHSSIGQEGGAVGSIVGMRAADAINGSHRGHHQFLAKALGYVAPDGIAPTDEVSARVQEVLDRTLAEILGLAPGYCKGRGGSMHLQWWEAGALGTNAIVGGGVPMAAGNAWAQLQRGDGDLTATYFGDGAVNIGSVLETMNLAAAWKLPLVFFIENNRYAVSTNVEEATAETRLSARGLGFAIPSWKVDGMNPLAVHLAMQEAEEYLRTGRGPVVIEADVYRYFHQNGPYPGSAFGYRSKEEEAEWRERDPIARVESEMIKLGHLTREEVDALRERSLAAVRKAAETVTVPLPDGKRKIKDELWPDPGFVDVGIRGDASELAGARLEEEATFGGELKEVKFIDVVSGVIGNRMEKQGDVVVMGEDIHRLNGGTNGATKGLKARFPDRILGTPISENAFTGLGLGVALEGRYRPIVEFMYADFMWVAADQLFNQVGKVRHMFGGTNRVPFVLRSKLAQGSGYGSQHTMDPAGVFATNPGFRIVAPSTPFDYIGLMNAALELEDPVVVMEHVDLYASTGKAPVDDLDYQIELGKAAVRRTGDDLTVISYLNMVAIAAEALDRTGISADLIDLRWLDRASLDWDAIGESVRKTGNVLIVEQGAVGTSYGGWLSDEIQRRFFDYLDQPVERVHGREASPSISKVLEAAANADVDDVVEGLTRTARNVGIEIREA
ncbi:alpha-ketoacid dehydrogenase subunit alpha/beta [Leucobacter ruminantium]|uniref:dihydrolipoyllysine-residue succinyltransferase n=1 Tax=Leucobacter ruminantium TaxID=1289170 RepID=A0A939LVB6_9MICO|nr:alpha-ketoacid dehydrogenase subunit alpha/beta [Leucobacter ruminantium]MBO1805077.1 MFS transporter [Leucobacter ruminantium]